MIRFFHHLIYNNQSASLHTVPNEPCLPALKVNVTLILWLVNPPPTYIPRQKEGIIKGLLTIGIHWPYVWGGTLGLGGVGWPAMMIACSWHDPTKGHEKSFSTWDDWDPGMIHPLHHFKWLFTRSPSLIISSIPPKSFSPAISPLGVWLCEVIRPTQ